jgi:hypothetical protein
MVTTFSTGDGVGSYEAKCLMTVEKSVIKVRQTSKLQAVTANRLWTVHDVSAFLGVPVGTLYRWRYMRIGPRACLPRGPAHPLRPSSRAYGWTLRTPMAGNIQRRPDGKWRARYRDANHREHARHFARASATPSAGWHHKRSPSLAVSGSVRSFPRSRSENGYRSGSRVRSS